MTRRSTWRSRVKSGCGGRRPRGRWASRRRSPSRLATLISRATELETISPRVRRGRSDARYRRTAPRRSACGRRRLLRVRRHAVDPRAPVTYGVCDEIMRGVSDRAVRERFWRLIEDRCRADNTVRMPTCSGSAVHRAARWVGFLGRPPDVGDGVRVARGGAGRPRRSRDRRASRDQGIHRRMRGGPRRRDRRWLPVVGRVPWAGGPGSKRRRRCGCVPPLPAHGRRCGRAVRSLLGRSSGSVSRSAPSGWAGTTTCGRSRCSTTSPASRSATVCGTRSNETEDGRRRGVHGDARGRCAWRRRPTTTGPDHARDDLPGSRRRRAATALPRRSRFAVPRVRPCGRLHHRFRQTPVPFDESWWETDFAEESDDGHGFAPATVQSRIASAEGTSAASQIFASSEAVVEWKCSTSVPLSSS